MTTALDDEKNITDAILNSCDAYFIKPVYFQSLEVKIRQFHLI